MAGLLNELLNYIDGAKRTARNNLAMWLEDPEIAAARMNEGLQGQIEAFHADPAGRAGDFIPGGGLAGVIRKGGMPELVAVHQAPLERYALWAQTQGKLPQELYSPSIAINKGAVSQDFGSETGGTIHFIGRPDALDPARINARLLNRDFYSPRDPGGYYTGGRSDLLTQALLENEQRPFSAYGGRLKPEYLRRNFAEDRLADRELIKNDEPLPMNLRFLESPNADLLAAEHAQAVNSSPVMRSFAEFEKNPRGAALLGESSLTPIAAASQARADLFTKLDQLWGKYPELRAAIDKGPLDFTDNIVRMKGNEAKKANLAELYKLAGGDELRSAVREYHKALAYLPSQYAELKVSGPLQIRGNNFSGAIIAPPRKPTKLYQPESVNAVADLLRQRGIPTMINDPAAPLTPQDLGWLARAYSEGAIK